MSSFMSKNTFKITLYIQYSDKYILLPTGKLTKKVEDLDSLHFMMEVLQEVREKEFSIDVEINPIMDMYHLLEFYLPAVFHGTNKHDMGDECTGQGGQTQI